MYSDLKEWSDDSIKFHVLNQNRFRGISDSEEIYSLNNYQKTFFDLRAKNVGRYLPNGTEFFLLIGLVVGSIFIVKSIIKFRNQNSKQRKVNN